MDEEEVPIFVTSDARMKDGLRHPVDIEITPANCRIMTSEEAMEAIKDQGEAQVAPVRDYKKPDPGYVTMTVPQVQELAKQAMDTYKVFGGVAATMTQEQAEFVRDIRCEQRGTWRYVAQAWTDTYGSDFDCNQLAGMALCQRAAEMFGEDYYQGAWN